MTDSYHFESVAKFRIGGAYRRNDQTIVKVVRMNCESHVRLWEERLPGRSFGEMQSEDGYAKGYVCLDDGRYVKAEDAEHPQNLIPGELVQRDGQWVAADAPIVFPSGAAVLTSGDKIVGRVEASPATYDVSVGKSLLTAEELHSAIRAVLDSFRAQDAIPEPIRPALDWSTATPFDTFGADFIVTKGEVPTAPLHTSPTTDSAYPAIAGLLRG